MTIKEKLEEELENMYPEPIAVRVCFHTLLKQLKSFIRTNYIPIVEIKEWAEKNKISSNSLTIKEKLEELDKNFPAFSAIYYDNEEGCMIGCGKQIKQFFESSLNEIRSSLMAEIKEWAEKNNHSWDEDHPWIFAKDLIDFLNKHLTT
jgi:hypothetical protein